MQFSQRNQPIEAGYTIGGITPQQEPLVSYTIYNNLPDYSDTNQDAATLREEIALGWANLVGITNSRAVRTITQADIDGTAAYIINTVGWPKSNQSSQEFQLLSPERSAIKWIGGLYYYREKGG
jgi:iron complex outermembrane receptor protein